MIRLLEFLPKLTPNRWRWGAQSPKLRLTGLGFAIAILTGWGCPGLAAERVLLKYGPLEIDIPVTALETYVQTGTATSELKPYLNFLSGEQQTQIRQFLKVSLPLTPTLTQHILREPIVQDFLNLYLGELLQTADSENGAAALEAAAVAGADGDDGLSVLQVIQEFPSDTLQVNVPLVFKVMEEAKVLRTTTRALVQDLETATATTAVSQTLPTPGLELSQPGPFSQTQQTLNLTDTQRDRQLAVDFYLPNATAPNATAPSQKGGIPVIVIENGHGGRRDYFNYLATHLASHGFAVAIPDHPGSDYQQQQKFIDREAPTIFLAEEFVDRPLDVTFLLNELERLNPIQFQGRLNTQQVGVLGYSLGGTTALSLAGAQFDFEQLEQDCGRDRNLWNLSLVFQCRALTLPREPYALRDNRVKAVYIFVSFSQSLFGRAGLSEIQIPVFIQALVEDFATPLAIEQLPTFDSLTQNVKYLGVVSGFPHVEIESILRTYTESPAADPIDQSAALATDAVPLSRERKGMKSTLNPFSLAFFKAHIAQDMQYEPYLQAAYAKAFSEASPYDVSFVRSLPPAQLETLKDLQEKVSGVAVMP